MQRRWLFGLIVLLLLAAGWWLVPGAERGAAVSSAPAEGSVDSAAFDEPVAAEPVVPRATASAAASDPVPVASNDSSAKSSEPLPGALPLPELVEELQSRAQSGDAAAACRLGIELAKCRLQLRSLPSTDDEEAALARMRENGRTDAQMASVLETQRRERLKRASCEALPPGLIDRTPWYMLQSALAGNTTSMVAFARLGDVSMAALVADPELYAEYRLHAFTLWQRALRQGSIDAVWLWFSAVNDQRWGNVPLLGVLPSEYRQADRPWALIERINDAGRLPAGVRLQELFSGDTGSSRAPIEVSAEARAWADEFYRRHLEASTELVLADSRQRQMLDHFNRIGAVSDWNELAERSEELEAAAYNERCASPPAR